MSARRLRAVAVLVLTLVAIGVLGIFRRGSAQDTALVATARRGTLTVTLTESGVLKAAESITYRSPLEGREVEITYLAPEGTQAREGDLLVRLDTSALTTELERALQAIRQIEMELQGAAVDREEAALAVQAVTEGVGTLAVDEARTNLRLARAKAGRLRDAHENLRPLLAKGYITREELERSALECDEAEARAELAERALKVLVERTHPAEEQSARLRLAGRHAQVQHLLPKLEEARTYVATLRATIERSATRAPRPGLVVYEENFAVMPRRKIRVGDRVTPSQGLITLPDLRRMQVESSARESDLHLVRPGQTARVLVDAFPGLRLSGLVARLGVLAREDSAGADARFALSVDLHAANVTLRPGMNARVDIVVAELRDVVMVPVNAVFVRAGISICYVLRGSAVESRMVEAGRANDTDVEIREGLRPGERVALTDMAAAVKPTPAAGRSREH